MAIACNSAAITQPSVFGAQILSLEATAVQSHTFTNPFFTILRDQGASLASPVDFCNVTITHTHLGKNDTLRTQIWLPTDPSWNGRIQMGGGGGWAAGLDDLAAVTMSKALSQGYVTAGVDGGVPTDNFLSPAAWALTSPGNVDYNRLQDFAAIALHDGALFTKAVTASFYSQAADYSYWNGCSQGGRQGYMLAQRYPDIFDGISATAPAINFAQFFVSQTYPQQVLNELGEYPDPCEYQTLTKAAINACDGHDGLLDGIISHPDSCTFDPYKLVGTPADCDTSGPKTISRTAAAAMHAAWHGTRTANGSLLWPSIGYEANPANNILATVCAADGTCKSLRNSLYVDFIKYFVRKDPSYDIDDMTRKDFEHNFHAGVHEYGSILNAASPDLSEFRAAGGKLLTWHGLVCTFRSFLSYRY